MLNLFQLYNYQLKIQHQNVKVRFQEVFFVNVKGIDFWKQARDTGHLENIEPFQTCIGYVYGFI